MIGVLYSVLEMKANEIIRVRDEMKLSVQRLKCTCGSFAIQINQGCECQKGTTIKKLNIELQEAIEKL